MDLEVPAPKNMSPTFDLDLLLVIGRDSDRTAAARPLSALTVP